ncbi:MAG: O-antigen ligase family protein [Acidimicrobiales bacterium]
MITAPAAPRRVSIRIGVRSVRRWVVVLGLVLSAIGAWTQLIVFEQVAVSFAGLIWAAEVLLLAMLSVSLNRFPLRLVLGTMLMVVPVFWGSLLTFSRPVGGSAAATIFGLVSLPLATTAAAVAVGESARSERLIRKGLTAFACGIAASTLVKVAVLGTGGRELSSRSFGLASAVGLVWLISQHPSPFGFARDWRCWLGAAAVALSLSRTATVAALTALLLVSWSGYPRNQRSPLRVAALIVIAVLGLVSALSTSTVVQNRVFGLEQTDGIAFSGRENLWPGVIDAIRAEPYVGAGLGRSDILTLRLDGVHRNPHNEFLRLGYEVGIVATSCLLLGLVLLQIDIRRRWRSVRHGGPLESIRRDVAVSLALLVVLLYFMMFDNVLLYLGTLVPIGTTWGYTYGRVRAAEHDRTAFVG